MRALILCGVVAAGGVSGACAAQPYEAMPVSSYQWQRRQEAIQRQETERLNRCEAVKADAQRYNECRRPGGATR